MNGRRAWPRWKIALNFGTIAQGPVSRDLRLANAGKSTLKGKIRVVDGPWLSVAANTFSLAAGAKGKIEVQANPLPDQTGETISFGNLSIKSNGGDTEILAEARHLAPVKKKGRKLRILAATTMYLAVLFFLFLLTVFGYDMYLMTFPASLIVTGGYFYWLVRGRRSAKQKYVAPPKVTKQKSTYKSSEPIKVVIPKQKSSKTRSNKLKTDVLVIGATGRRAKKTGKEIKNRGFRVETGDINVSVTSIVIGKPSLILFGPMKLDRGNIKQYQRLVKRAAGTKLVLATRDSNASDKIIRANLLAYDYIIGDEVEKLGNWVNKFLARRYYQPQGGLTRQVGSLVLDANSRHATLSSKQIVLTDIEFDILLTLVDRLDFVNYKTIGRQVWGVTTGRKAATDIFVERLRRKLAAGNVRIVNVENQGYLIVAEG